jgi:hypothetical protein
MSGIAHEGNDTFWVATYYPDPATIYQVDTLGSVIKQFTAPDDQPWDICLQDSGLWMADKWGDSLYMIDTADGALLASYASEGTDPAGIVWDGQFLWYCDEGSGGVDYLYKVDLSGAGTPAIYLDATEHDYGVVTIGDSPTWDVTVQNVGTADLEITGVSFSGSTELACTTTLPITLAPTEQAQLSIAWSPLAYGELDAIATVESTDPIHPDEEISLTGNAVYSGPEINIPVASHDYGTVRNGAYTRWLFEIENQGDATLSIDDISFDDAHFTIDDYTEPVTFPIDVGVLSSVQIGIWFSPEADIAYSATVTISNNDIDEDPSNVSVQGSGLEADYPIGTELWDYTITGGYDNSPKAIAPLPDITGDGVNEVIICSEDDYVRCFNGNSHSIADVLWEHEIYAGAVYSQNGLAITEDVDDDGYADVAVGSAWGGRLVRTISGKTGEEIWTYDTHEYGDGGWVYQVDCSYDYNGDGTIDVLAAAGNDGTNTGPKRAFCLNGKTGAKIWECQLGGPGFSVIGVGDFTGNGLPDAVAGASTVDESQGKVFGINGEDGGIEWTYFVNGTSVWALAQIDDITGDGVKDIGVGDFSMTSGYVYGLDATDGGEEFVRSGFGPILRISTVDDVNGNRYRDIAPAHSSSSLRMVDGNDGEIIWIQSQADKVHCVVRTTDLSGDAINDLMVGTLYTNNYCYFIDGTDGEELHSIYFGTPVDGLGAIADIVGDGSWEMVAGGRDGTVKCFSGGLNHLENEPPGQPIIEGPASGKPTATYTYSLTSYDPDDNDVYYYIEWGDDSVENWAGPYASGVAAEIDHAWDEDGEYSIRAQARDVYSALSVWSDTFVVTIENQSPNKPTIAGPETGVPGIAYEYTVGVTDPDGDSAVFLIEWGDDSVELWIGPYASGEDVDVLHSWDSVGQYPIRTMARDIYGAESAWSDTLLVDIHICGDADRSGGVDIDDAVYLIAYIFSGGPEPDPYAAGDVDCSGGVDIDDVVYLIAYIFSGGYDPCDPDDDGVPDC